MSVPDSTVWAYGEALRELARTKGFTNIQFSRLTDLVPMTLPKVLDKISYIANATNFRLALMNNFRHQDWDVSEKISEDRDVCMTYRGYLKFLQTDLAQVFPVSDTLTKTKFKRGLEDIAKQMLIRGQVRQTNLIILCLHETVY